MPRLAAVRKDIFAKLKLITLLVLKLGKQREPSQQLSRAKKVEKDTRQNQPPMTRMVERNQWAELQES